MSGSSQIWLYVGTYNRREPHAPVACGAGLVTCVLDLQTGAIEQRHVFADIVNSSYLACDPMKGLLFSTSESLDLENSVHMFQCKSDGSLERLAIQSARGLATCHLALIPGGKIGAASYLQSCISIFPVKEGGMEPAAWHFDYQGSGPNAARQEASHAHQVVTRDKWFYVVDLGSDCVWCHDVALAQAPVAFQMPSGHGPRHMAFHPVLKRAYVLCELTGTVAVCNWDSQSGSLEVAATTRVLGSDVSAGAIRVHPMGKTLWTSLRSTHSLRYYHLDPGGNASTAGEVPLGDGEPRDFNISPDGRWLVSANQSANHLAVIELNPATGLPANDRVTRFPLGTPCSVAFMPVHKHHS